MPEGFSSWSLSAYWIKRAVRNAVGCFDMLNTRERTHHHETHTTAYPDGVVRETGAMKHHHVRVRRDRCIDSGRHVLYVTQGGTRPLQIHIKSIDQHAIHHERMHSGLSPPQSSPRLAPGLVAPGEQAPFLHETIASFQTLMGLRWKRTKPIDSLPTSTYACMAYPSVQKHSTDAKK